MADLVGESPAPSTIMTLTTQNTTGGDEVAGTMAMVVRDQIKTATVNSIAHTTASFVAPRVIHRLTVQGSILTLQRNECIQRMQGDWIVFIDDDMVWQADALARLHATMTDHDLDVVGALCFRRSYPYQPTMYIRETPSAGFYFHIEKWTEGDVVEVDATGLAFLLISKRGLEKLIGGPMPPYEQRLKEPVPPNIFKWDGVKGEDIRFCEELKAAGVRLFIDTSVKVLHLGEVEIGERQFWQAVAERDRETQKIVARTNRKYAVPTLTPREARKRLYGS